MYVLYVYLEAMYAGSCCKHIGQAEDKQKHMYTSILICALGVCTSDLPAAGTRQMVGRALPLIECPVHLCLLACQQARSRTELTSACFSATGVATAALKEGKASLFLGGLPRI